MVILLKVSNLGPDVSEHNSSVDWSKVSKAGYFAAARSTYGKTSDDSLFEKPRVTGLLTVKYPIAYHYAYPNLNSPEEEALNFVSKLREQDCLDKVLPVLDYEEYHPSRSDQAWADRFSDKFFDLAGFRPGLYLGISAKERLNNVRRFKWVWLPQYGGTSPDFPSWVPEEKRILWQFTDGQFGPSPHSFDGIGPCDINKYLKSDVHDLADLYEVHLPVDTHEKEIRNKIKKKRSIIGKIRKQIEKLRIKLKE